MSLSREDLSEFAEKSGIDLGRKVHIKKLSIVDNPAFAAANAKDYKFGQDNGPVSLPIDYWVEGFLIADLVKGAPLRLIRTVRNGIDKLGTLSTSIVTEIGSEENNVQKVCTENSVYFITYLEE